MDNDTSGGIPDNWGKNRFKKPQKVVVCAACKYEKLTLCGARHWDSLMRSQFMALKNHGCDVSSALFEQGFVDQFGEFLTRAQAMKTAIAAGQKVDIERGCGGDADTLYSEGLY